MQNLRHPDKVAWGLKTDGKASAKVTEEAFPHRFSKPGGYAVTSDLLIKHHESGRAGLSTVPPRPSLTLTPPTPRVRVFSLYEGRRGCRRVKSQTEQAVNTISQHLEPGTVPGRHRVSTSASCATLAVLLGPQGAQAQAASELGEGCL